MGVRYGIASRTRVLPEELVKQIDELVGPRGRNAFLVETAKAELKRRRLLEFLRGDEVIWKDEDHPELAAGTEAWVRDLHTDREVWRREREREAEEKVR